MMRYRFDRPGPLALASAFFGSMFAVVAPEPFRLEGDVAIVDVRGPMTHHADWFCDSYDAIRERVAAALESPATSVVLDIDSPGGDVAGLFEAARAIRDAAAAAGKPLYAIVEGVAASGGYALACAASKIAISPTATVGSIGVISPILDTVARDQAFGERWVMVASGARKTDRNPHVPITEAAVQAVQAQVDELAAAFFEWVAESREISPDDVRSLDAGLFVGKRALEARLADVVGTKETLFAMVATSSAQPPAAPEKEAAMTWKEALTKAAEEGDEEAKKALAALEPDGDEKKDDGEKKAEEAPPAKKDDEKKDDGEKAAASSNVVSFAARLERLEAKANAEAKAQAKAEATAKASLLADLPLTEAQAKVLSAMPLEQLRAHLEAFPVRAQAGEPKLARQPLVGANVATDTSGPSALSEPKTVAELDAAFGLTKPKAVIERTGIQQIFRPMTPEQAKAHLAAAKKEA